MRLILCVHSLLFLLFADAKFITIDLYRQQTPRSAIQKTPNIPEYGVWLDWFKKPAPPPRTNDTISLLRHLDSEFYAKIFVGSPGKPTNVIFDTAWSTSWIISNDCSILKLGCWFHSKYNHEKSSTYTKDGRKFVADEGSYNLTGYYSRDTLKFGHSSINQTFVEMTSIPYWYVFSEADGVIGLGLPRTNVNPFFSNILAQTNITQPIFSIYLNRDRSSDQGGDIMLGGINKKHIHVTKNVPDPITYVGINANSGLWEFSMDSIFITVKGKDTVVCGTDCTAIPDTSTNTIIASHEMLEDINQMIHARPFLLGRFQVDCDTVNRLPFITFVIGGTNFTLLGTDYTQKLSYGPITVCLSAFTAATTVSEDKRWVLGGAFLAKYFTIYDMGNKRLGVVRAA